VVLIAPQESMFFLCDSVYAACEEVYGAAARTSSAIKLVRAIAHHVSIDESSRGFTMPSIFLV
jgi:hypothetical protein